MGWIRVKRLIKKPWLAIYKDEDTGKTEIRNIGTKDLPLAQPPSGKKKVEHKIRKELPKDIGAIKAFDGHKYHLKAVDPLRSVTLKLAQDLKYSGQIAGYRIEKSNYGYELWGR